jgi:hypothetical protein
MFRLAGDDDDSPVPANLDADDIMASQAGTFHRLGDIALFEWPLPRRSGWAYCFAHSPTRRMADSNRSQRKRNRSLLFGSQNFGY